MNSIPNMDSTGTDIHLRFDPTTFWLSESAVKTKGWLYCTSSVSETEWLLCSQLDPTPLLFFNSLWSYMKAPPVKKPLKCKLFLISGS